MTNEERKKMRISKEEKLKDFKRLITIYPRIMETKSIKRHNKYLEEFHAIFRKYMKKSEKK